MGYSAKQRKVKTEIDGANKLVKDLKAMEDAAVNNDGRSKSRWEDST